MANSFNADEQKLNATMRKFGAPESIVHQYQHWTVLLRPAQVTLGSLILAANSEVEQFAALEPPFFGELQQVVSDLETVLQKSFSYQKMNYLMLMMVDPHVHFHVIPRFSNSREFEGQVFSDSGWPGPPNLGQANEVTESLLTKLCERLRRDWP